MWQEVQSENSVLSFKNECAIAEEILDDTVLTLMDVLEHPEIDALVIVRCEELLLDAMDALVGNDDDVEKVVVEAFEEFEVREDKEKRHDREECPVCEAISNTYTQEDRVTHAEDEGVPAEELEERVPETYPVLSCVEHKYFIAVLCLEVDSCRRASDGGFHDMAVYPRRRLAMRKIAWRMVMIRMRRSVKKENADASTACGRHNPCTFMRNNVHMANSTIATAAQPAMRGRGKSIANFHNDSRTSGRQIAAPLHGKIHAVSFIEILQCSCSLNRW